MRRQLKTIRTASEIENEKMFGPYLEALHYVKYPLHATSFYLGTIWIYGALSGKSEVLGMAVEGLLFYLITAFSLCVGLLIEYIHGKFPPLFYYGVFTFKKTFGSWSKGIAFVLSGIVIFGVTRLSQISSSGGGESKAASMYVEPTPTNLTPHNEAYSLDSSRIASAAATRSSSIETIAKADAAKSKASFDRQIAKNAKEVRLWTSRYNTSPTDQNRHNLNGWKEKLKISKQAANRAYALKIDEGKAEAAKARLDAANQISSISISHNDFRVAAIEGDAAKIVKAKADNEALKAFGVGLGKWVVYGLLLLIGIEGYLLFICGYEPPGFAFKYPKRLSTVLGYIKGIFADKADHSIKRLEATKEHLKTRQQAKPFAWPSGRLSLIGSAFAAVAFFIVQTVVYSEADQAQASIVPFPYNWAGLILCVLILGLTVKREAGKRVGLKQPVSDTDKASDTGIESVSRKDEKTAETLVPQDPDGDTDSGEIQMTTDEITTLKKFCRTNYERIHTAATQVGRDSARNKHKQSKAALRAIGVKVSTSNNKIKRQVKRDGKQMSVSYRELIISK